MYICFVFTSIYQGTARTQSPTTKNSTVRIRTVHGYTHELITFGLVHGGIGNQNARGGGRRRLRLGWGGFVFFTELLSLKRLLTTCLCYGTFLLLRLIHYENMEIFNMSLITK